MDDQEITLLAIEAKKYSRGTSQRRRIVTILITEISLKFGSEFSEGILSETFQEILISINSIIDNFRPEKYRGYTYYEVQPSPPDPLSHRRGGEIRTSERGEPLYQYFMEWVRERYQAKFQQIKPDLLTDDEMTELAVKAQNCPQDSPNRTLILQIFVSKVFQQYQNLYNDDIGKDAKNNLFGFLLIHIDKYNANYQTENHAQPVPVMKWINYLFGRRFLPDARIRDYNQRRNIQDLDDIDILENLKTPLLSETVRECLQIVPDFTLRHLRGRSDVNFKEIAIRRLDRIKLTKIAEELEVEYRSMQTFYLNCLRNRDLMKILRECCTN